MSILEHPSPLRVSLSQFEGPLDLLLHLIQKAEMDIEDIFVSEITAQYLAYMDQIDELDMERSTEFLTMAATLVYIKSRALLPRAPVVVAQGDEEEIDPEEKLLQQLREYQIYQNVSHKLEQMNEHASQFYTRLPEENASFDTRIELKQSNVQTLYRAFCIALQQKEAVIQPASFERLHKDIYTIEAAMSHVKTSLSRDKSVSFQSLFDHKEKMDMIVTFMAVLEMMNHGELFLEQENAFADIYLRKAS